MALVEVETVELAQVQVVMQLLIQELEAVVVVEM